MNWLLTLQDVHDQQERDTSLYVLGRRQAPFHCLHDAQLNENNYQRYYCGGVAQGLWRVPATMAQR